VVELIAMAPAPAPAGRGRGSGEAGKIGLSMPSESGGVAMLMEPAQEPARDSRDGSVTRSTCAAAAAAAAAAVGV
jgi:hypothetical protein